MPPVQRQPRRFGFGSYVIQPANAPRGVAGAQVGVEGLVAGGGGCAVFEVGAVGDELAAGGQAVGGALHERGGAGPGGNVHQVGAEHEVERAGGEGRAAVGGPGGLQHVEPARRQGIGQAGAAGLDGEEQLVAAVGGLPLPAGQLTREVRHVLAGAAGDFQRAALGV